MRALTLLVLTLVAGCAPEDPVDTTPDEPEPDCAPFTRDGPEGETNGEPTDDFLRYNLRTPPGYDPTVGHPLLMVYAPAGANATQTEGFTGLTSGALASGYVVAYANHVSPRDVASVEPLGRMAAEITERWCIDTERVYLTGHSDGGTASSVIALFDQMGFPPAAIAPSAAGISRGLLDTLECPDPTPPTLVLHSRNDGLFPVADGFGRRAADWWAACSGCDATPGSPDSKGCVSYENCDEGAEVMYCESAGSHGTWAPMNPTMLDFFGRH